jgi:hypothetical protein
LCARPPATLKGGAAGARPLAVAEARPRGAADARRAALLYYYDYIKKSAASSAALAWCSR